MSTSTERWAKSVKSRGDYARERRVALVMLLATEQCLIDETDTTRAFCAACGEAHPFAELEIDHLDGRDLRRT